MAAAPDGATRTLARFVAETDFNALPPRVVEAMKVYLLDDLACGFLGSVQPWSAIVVDLVRAGGGREEASIFGQAWRTTAAQAALANGVMIGAFESEHFGHNAHPSGTVFPAAFALAEREHRSGRDFLTALTLGYELVCRIGAAQTNAVETERGIHNPAANGPFGAAAAAARLLGLDAEHTAGALGVAGSHCGGLTEFAWDGAMTKRLHLGRAAQLGLESALLARAGFTGPTTVLEGRYGYFNAYSPAPKGELLLDRLGEQWMLEGLVVKAYPCHASSQALVAAIQELKRSGVAMADVQRLHLRAGERLLEPRFLNAAPTTMLGAQYSIPYTMAIAVCRDLDDPASYDESVLSDPRIRRLAGLVTWEKGDPDIFVERRAELEVTIADEQRVIQAESFPGAADSPLTFEGAAGKFHRFAGRFVDAARRQRIVDAVRTIEQLADIATLAAAIRTAGVVSEAPEAERGRT